MLQKNDVRPIPSAPDLLVVLDEAEDIAKATGVSPNSAHMLLAFFTSRNQAERVLRDRNIDEDRLIEIFDPKIREPRECVREILDRAAQVAASCGAREVDCLHVLVAMTRARDSLAFTLLSGTNEKLATLRTRALTILTGAVPRWLSNGRRLEEEEAVAVSQRPHHARSAIGPAGRPINWKPPLVQPSVSKPSRTPAPKSDRQRRREEAKQASKVDAPKAKAVPPPPPPPSVVEAPEPLPEEPSAPPAPPDDPARAWLLNPDRYPWLTSLGRNLSAEAARGELDRLVGRTQEVDTLIDILGKRRANNPCLIGEPGVGKTAVVEGLAARLVAAPPTTKLGEKIVIALDVGGLLVGTHLRGSFSEKLQGLKEEVKRSRGRVIVFFDELHTLVGAGAAGDGPQDAANELKSALSRGSFPCVGATTYDEYNKHVESDPALSRRFVPVLIKEPSPAETKAMLAQILPAYAQHHEVEYAEAAIDAAVDLTSRYIAERFQPDKSIAVLDLAGSRAARANERLVSRDLVAQIVAERADVPVERLLSSDRERLLGLETLLRREIIGHERPLQRIAEVVRRNAAGFAGRRPKGVFLLVGPTGVGKTETAKAVARVLFGSEDAMVRFDLSEYSEAHAVARLVGAPPGYVGHDAGGQLTEAVRRRPGSVILFDEIEKAHREVLQLLLQILDEGRLTDSHGRTVSFAETIVLMTSNLGADGAAKKRIGFGDGDREDLEARILDGAKAGLPPELWGRIEERLVFLPLSREEVKQIARLLAAESSQRLSRERGITYDLDELAIEFVLDEGGFDASFGARPMRHALARIVEAPIASRILEGRIFADEHVLVSTRADGTLVFLVGDTSLSQRPLR